ncbi:uncharacterized protein LOC120354905 [Nilaparvata lugens]|uniref:uncharacterized protein LOC120354904 n=1 Tax=Nilaparvata lugens TaxID=108931 RepID=UPI00193E4DEE|nr:uncharacterized protein LOC120354904 [Nilaparvata lugens]XP_039298925.1 uncharacterized protein LOC120354904 [Nilaparvata lugens]XP_039298926.1 uncharacterized protein LOC120354905 [Nilaparvata lugens]
MEAALIAEGFSLSEEMYGVRYNRLIADGDSSVYKTLLDRRPYKNTTILKIECRNHLLRNYCNKIREIALTSDKGHSPITLRKKIGDRLLRLRYGVTRAVIYHQKNPNKIERIEMLKEDILNGPNHVFGDHGNCKNYFCSGTDLRNLPNLVPSLEAVGLFQRVKNAARFLSLHASSLLEDVDSNYVEHYNHAVAKFVGGKRINFTSRGSYQARCEGAVVQHNTGMVLYNLHKTMCNSSSPGRFYKSVQVKRRKKIEQDRRRRNISSRKSLFSTAIQKTTVDHDYGPNAQRPDISEKELVIEKNRFLASLVLSEESRHQLERRTVLQHHSAEWLEERRKRITASNFGRISKRRPNTGCENVVRELLYGGGKNCSAMEYGRMNEEAALKKVSEIAGQKILKCGLFIDADFPFLAASPDGLLEDGHGIVEVKCPQTIKDLLPREAAKLKILKFCKIEDTNIELNTNHNYYYQIQGQLHITKRQYCLFCIWSPKGTEVVTVYKDEQFWSSKILEQVKKFYMDCVLPELVDPRHTLSMPIRNPDWIIEAQEARKKK